MKCPGDLGDNIDEPSVTETEMATWLRDAKGISGCFQQREGRERPEPALST